MRDIPESPRIIEIKKKQRNKIVKIIIVSVLFLVILMFGLSYLSYEKHVVIRDIKVTGAYVLDEEAIIQASQNEMSGKYLYLFSKKNTFIYPKNKIYESLLRSFPRIEELNIGLNGLNELEIAITERKGEFLYCGKEIPLDKESVGENCFFVNDDGFIFDEAPYFSGDIYFKYYMTLGEDADPLGKQMLPVEKFHSLAYFFSKINALELKPVYFYMDGSETNYLYLEKKSNFSNPRIIFKDTDSLEVLLDNLTLAMKKEEFSNEISSKYDALEYIDLRFKNKILYKFR